MDHINDQFFQVSVKGLFFNKNNQLLMVQEDTGMWELPGGRIQKNEDLKECLIREICEETGLTCTILDSNPAVIYSTTDQNDRPRIMIFYRVHFENLDFTPSEECVAIDFFDCDKIKNLSMVPQMKKLPDFLPLKW